MENKEAIFIPLRHIHLPFAVADKPCCKEAGSRRGAPGVRADFYGAESVALHTALINDAGGVRSDDMGLWEPPTRPASCIIPEKPYQPVNLHYRRSTTLLETFNCFYVYLGDVKVHGMLN